MGAHPKSIDAIGVLQVGIEARDNGARDVQNMAFAVLLKAALMNHPRLRLVRYTNDKYGEDPDETAQDLIGVIHVGSRLRLRAPVRLLQKFALDWCNKVIGDDDMEPRLTGRRGGRERHVSKEEISRLTSALLLVAPEIPGNMLEGVGPPRPAPTSRERTLATT